MRTEWPRHEKAGGVPTAREKHELAIAGDAYAGHALEGGIHAASTHAARGSAGRET